MTAFLVYFADGWLGRVGSRYLIARDLPASDPDNDLNHE